MSTRERVHFMIDQLNDEQIEPLMKLLKSFGKSDAPNEDTKAAIKESKQPLNK